MFAEFTRGGQAGVSLEVTSKQTILCLMEFNRGHATATIAIKAWRLSMAAALLLGAGAWLGRRQQIHSRAPVCIRPSLLLPPGASPRTPLPPGGSMWQHGLPNALKGTKLSSVSSSSFTDLLPPFGQNALPSLSRAPEARADLQWPQPSLPPAWHSASPLPGSLSLFPLPQSKAKDRMGQGGRTHAQSSSASLGLILLG